MPDPVVATPHVGQLVRDQRIELFVVEPADECTGNEDLAGSEAAPEHRRHPAFDEADPRSAGESEPPRDTTHPST